MKTFGVKHKKVEKLDLFATDAGSFGKVCWRCDVLKARGESGAGKMSLADDCDIKEVWELPIFPVGKSKNWICVLKIQH